MRKKLQVIDEAPLFNKIVKTSEGIFTFKEILINLI